MDWVKIMLNAIGGGVDSGILSTMKRSPAEFNSTLYGLSDTIASDVGKPLASAVLSVVLVLQLINVANRAEGDRQIGVKLIGITMIQCAVILAFAQNASLILQAINAVGDWAMGTVDVATSVSTGGGLGNLGDMIGDQHLNPLDTGLAMMLLLLPFLVSKVAGIVVTVVVYLRFIQLYLMAGFASMPVAFLGNEHTRAWGIGYFKRYTETVFQTVILFLAVAFYQHLDVNHPGKLADGQALSGWIIDNFGQLILASVLLIAVVALSNKVAKAIFGE
ncbi:hypothetical protein [Bifidobacterium mongoliense]|jgi:hypothetical protein|uniref:hypothetical protein n=1 Tax=Bifidobacterium mongoliense TaxID=518643 RepID=UPI0030EC9099